MAEFQVRKQQFSDSRTVSPGGTDAQQALADGEVLTRIERFAYTANNITYAATGEMLGYWQFFPPAGDEPQHWGMTPVWGFAQVVASRCDQIPVGERLFGYFPPADYLKMRPVNVGAQRLFDGSAHRAQLPPTYNSYSRVAQEPGYDPDMDALRMLLWPLHVTAFCLYDKLRSNDWYGAQQIILLSASSKTSIGLAIGLAGDEQAPALVAVTSARNQAFVDGLGLYQDSLSYEALAQLPGDTPTVIVDMSGNSAALETLQTQLGASLKYCIRVGLTHWDEASSSLPADSAQGEFFFAPGHIQQRIKDWGADGFASKSAEYLLSTAAHSRAWLEIVHLDGLAELQQNYADICTGMLPPQRGLIVQM